VGCFTKMTGSCAGAASAVSHRGFYYSSLLSSAVTLLMGFGSGLLAFAKKFGLLGSRLRVARSSKVIYQLNVQVITSPSQTL
jgi:hypothetical protein